MVLQEVSFPFVARTYRNISPVKVIHHTYVALQGDDSGPSFIVKNGKYTPINSLVQPWKIYLKNYT